MNEAVPIITTPPAAAKNGANLGYQLYSGVLAIWKFLFGVALTQSLLGSILIVGWTWRAAQRTIQKYWWKTSGSNEACFCDFVQCSSFHRALGGWPNWILEHNRAWLSAHRTPGFPKLGRIGKALFHSLWLNFKIGLQSIFNTSVLTLPGSVLMLFSWYAGWHNSFNKGYEQALVGPLTGFGGIALFIAAMYYVPMAQMRQASTADWRSFYQFKLIWQLIRRKWLACFGLALLYTAFSVPVTVLKTLPEFFIQINPSLADRSPPELLQIAKTYYFYAAVVLFAAFVFLRLAAARIYASSLLGGVHSGALTEEALAENEWETLQRLDLLKVRPQPERHVLIRTVAWLGTRMGRGTTGVALFFLWFIFVAQVYVSEFFMKSPLGRGWLNQPLVQLPWFNYIPAQLKEEANDNARTRL